EARPARKKPTMLPAPGAPAASAGTGAARPGAPSEVTPDVEELAAAAFSEQPASNGAAEKPATIDFQCEFCEADLHVPATEAGKRMQCPNPECRRLIKVPTPKEKPKDWRELAKKGPAAAIINQPDKIDEAAWGTET